MRNHMKIRVYRRRGFTLIELVVVVLILGIISAVAAPRMFNTMTSAKQNSARQSCQIVRAAIEMYRSQDPLNGNPPTPSTLALSLAPFLKGPFPAAPIGINAGSLAVGASTGTTGLTATSTGEGWIYNATTGDFGLNDPAYISLY